MVSALALQMLILQGMPLTLDEVLQYQERLQAEIVERECLLASLKILQKYAVNGETPRSVDLSRLTSVLPSSTLLLGASAEQLPAPPNPPPPPGPPKPYVKPYIHPELEVLSNNNVGVVRWAIQRMTHDYSLIDIRKLLDREGHWIKGAQISVVLTRMKRQGEIEEIECGRGPVPSTFRAPESASFPQAEPADLTGGVEPAIASVPGEH
jgi:hypothetical protein